MAGVLELAGRGVDQFHHQAAWPGNHLRLGGEVQRLGLWPDNVRFGTATEGVVAGRDGEDAGRVNGQVVEDDLSPMTTAMHADVGGRPAHVALHHRCSTTSGRPASGTSLQRPDAQLCRRADVHRPQGPGSAATKRAHRPASRHPPAGIAPPWPSGQPRECSSTELAPVRVSVCARFNRPVKQTWFRLPTNATRGARSWFPEDINSCVAFYPTRGLLLGQRVEQDVQAIAVEHLHGSGEDFHQALQLQAFQQSVGGFAAAGEPLRQVGD